jgi:hypothetical protein
MYEMGARFYDPSLKRWLSPDTIVPDAGNPQALNRYADGTTDGTILSSIEIQAGIALWGRLISVNLRVLQEAGARAAVHKTIPLT